MSLKLPIHKRRCVFVDSTQQIIAAASGDGSRDRRSKRKRTTTSQLDILVASFVQSDSPSYETREDLASRCDMTLREVQVWFQNRRAKVLRERQRGSAANSAASRSPTPHNDVSTSSHPALSSQSRWRPEPRVDHAASDGLAGRAPSPRCPPATTEEWSNYWREQPEALVSPTESYSSGSDSLSVRESIPSLVSPGARSTSSYFSIDEPTTPLNLPSPTSAFFRLALDSPRATTPVDWFVDHKSHSSRASGLVGAVVPLPSLIPPGLRPRSPPSLSPSRRTNDDDTAPQSVRSTPSSPTSEPRASSHRLPSLRNLLNPDPADIERGEAVLLKRSLLDGSRPSSSPRSSVVTRPSLGRRLATFDDRRLATIVSRSPSTVDIESAYGGSIPGSRRTSLTLSVGTGNDSGSTVSTLAAKPNYGSAGLGILAAAAVLVDNS
ncbi:hypothetical protein JCM8115_005458 [Rhodotorula mucilaginosa]